MGLKVTGRGSTMVARLVRGLVTDNCWFFFWGFRFPSRSDKCLYINGDLTQQSSSWSDALCWFFFFFFFFLLESLTVTFLDCVGKARKFTPLYFSQGMQGEAGIPGMPGPKGVTVSMMWRHFTEDLTRWYIFKFHFFPPSYFPFFLGCCRR